MKGTMGIKQKIILTGLLLGLCLLPSCKADSEQVTTVSDGEGDKAAALAENSNEGKAEGDAEKPENTEAEEPKDLVAIYVGNDLYTVADFSEAQVIEVDQGNGLTNEVTLTGHSVHMSHSSCDNQDCVQQGEITLENVETRVLMNWIICLPNGVTIELVPGEDQ